MDRPEFESRLRIFRSFGSKEHWEDNITRALMCAIVRSLSGPAILKGLIERAANYVDEASRAKIEDLSRAKLLIARTQVSFAATEPREDEVEGAFLLEIVPSDPAPSSFPQPLANSPDGEAGRFDGLLRLATDEGRLFEIAIESKLYEPVSTAQREKYCARLGADRCTCMRQPLKWSDVLSVIDSLPDVNRREPLVEDFVDYIESLWWLPGYRGFSWADFTPERREARFQQLRRLAESLCGPGKSFTSCDWVREDRGDVNLRLPGDGLLGNVGLASWEDDSIRAKLVIGYGGTPRRLLGADPQRISDVFKQLVQRVGKVDFAVLFRVNCWPREVLIASDTETVTTSEPWQPHWEKLIDLLALAESQRTVSQETLDDIRKHAADGEAGKIDSLGGRLAQFAARTRPVRHFGLLVVSALIEPKTLIDCGNSSDKAERVALGTLAPMVEALRNASMVALTSPVP
jgi:hypothetical protein